MDSLSQLPLHCLHIIFEELNKDNNSSTLASLLQTSRYLAAITHPFLYSNPYRFTPDAILPLHYIIDTRDEDPLISRIPTRTLLTSIAAKTALHKVLSLGTFDTTASGAADASTAAPVPHNNASPITDTPISPSLDYLAPIRHLHLQPWAPGLDHLWKWTQPPPGVADFILTQEFKELCKQGALFPTFNPRALYYNAFLPDKEFYQRCYQILFFREASWALANSILEQLQSLTIPFSIVGRYLEPSSMQRLGKLEQIHFLLDDLWKDEPRDKDEFGPMVQVVEEHTRLFPGVLKSVTSSHGALWSYRKFQWTENCPQAVQIEINRMLPTLTTPRLLTAPSLILQLMDPDATGLSTIEELDDWIGNHPNRYLF